MERFIFSMSKCFSIFFLFASIIVLCPLSFPCYSQELVEGFGSQFHRWERYVQDFRKDHNFALFMGRTEGSWKVRDFGSISEERYAMTGLVFKAQYSYHIPLWQSFGYFLGSSVGYYYESTRSANFKPSHSLHLPGLLVGVVYDFTPSTRVLFGLDAYLERLDGMEERNQEGKKALDATMLTRIDTGIMFDYFFSLNIAARIEAHQRNVAYNPMDNSEGKIESADFEKEDWWIGLGLVYHIL
ncbi:MAG: hypothetical protein AB8G05_12670 [Oligoflexales bacterium]